MAPQHDGVIANASGAAVRADLNNALAALITNSSGATSPATTYAFQFWADTTASQLKIRNAANDAWIVLMELDGTMLMEDGTVSAPGLAFASDLNTGFFRSAADKINFATGGAERLEIGSSEVVFNDPSNDVDFRVESNGNTHMLFVDAGNDRVGIGTTSPQVDFVVSNGGASGVEIDPGYISGNSLIQAFNRSGSSFDTLGLRAGAISFQIGGSTEKARIDSSGRLLVGASTARSNFFAAVASAVQVEGSDTPTSTISVVRNSNNADGPTVLLGRSRGTGNTIVQDDDRIGRIEFQANDGTNFLSTANIQAFVDGTPGTSDMPTRLTFGTCADGASSSTERMVINRLGNVSVGSTADNTDTKLYVAGSSSASTGNTYVGVNSSAQITFIVRDDGAFNTGQAGTSPYNLTTTAAADCNILSNGFLARSTSSRRFKTNIETLEDSYADAILNIEPVWFRSTAPGDALHPDWSYYGFVAEDVAAVDPRLVFWKTHEAEFTEDGAINEVELDEPIAEGVQYDRFVPHLLNLIKRQQQAIETLEAKVAALEAG